MVGFHFPLGSVRHEHVPNGQGAAVGVLPGVRNGKFDSSSVIKCFAMLIYDRFFRFAW